MGLPAGIATCPSLCEWIYPMHTNADGNLQNPLVREHALLRGYAICSLLLSVSHFHLLSSEIITQLDNNSMTPEICIRSPCSYSPIWPSPSDPTWHSVGKGSSQPSMQGSSYFSMQPQQSWVSQASITHLLCRDWRGRKVSCQKFKYRSTRMNGMWDHKWTQFYKSHQGKIWVLLGFQRTLLKMGWKSASGRWSRAGKTQTLDITAGKPTAGPWRQLGTNWRGQDMALSCSQPSVHMTSNLLVCTPGKDLN